MGLFVTFEGIEGSGKTTQIRKAADYLKEEGIPCVMTGEPGGTPVGGELRKILLDKTALALSGRTELLLFAADRAQHVEEVIVPAMEKGNVVLCDRFSDATVAYQGYGRGQDIGHVRSLCAFASRSLAPDMTFLFDIPADTGLDRITDRARRAGDSPREDRFERERLRFHEMVRDGYLTLAREEPDRFRVIDASRDIDVVHRDVRIHLKGLIER
ncbi:MAG: dTMP kinase [Deltaproteobacteria bacterium]|nr:dTMP kinase [Deltaproteobacteria bacterium]MBW2673940.1 dTMP kinase [Deltaproteobacteria bacterium]